VESCLWPTAPLAQNAAKKRSYTLTARQQQQN
jgi:hypothetical protein